MELSFKNLNKTSLINEKNSNQASSSESSLTMTFTEWLAVLGGALGAFMAILDIQITNASLREIQGSLGLDLSESGWISTAYLIAEIAVIPLTGYLTEVFGMRRYLIVNCVFFILSSMLCGLSWDLRSMILFRSFQGITGGVLIPMSFQIILLVMPPAQKSIGLAIFGMTATLAPTLGPSLGGWLTSSYGWRTTFFINFIPGLLTIWALSIGLPKTETNLNKLKNMDFLGAALLCTGLGTLTFFLEEGAKLNWFEDREIQIAFLISCSTLPIFILSQIYKKEPLLNLRLLTERNFGISAIVTTLSAIALYGGIYALSLYLGQIQQYGAMEIGQVMMWVGIPQLFVMPLLPWLMSKFNLRFLIGVGLLLFTISNWMNSNLTADYGGDQFRFSLMIRAIGQPLFMIPLSAMGMALIRPAEVGNASAIFNVMRNLGGSFGIALAGTALVSRQALHFSRSAEHFSSYNSVSNELLFGLKNYLLINGSDPMKVQEQAELLATSIAKQESYIQSFGDIYFLMCIGLCFTLVLIFFMKDVNLRDSGSSITH